MTFAENRTYGVPEFAGTEVNRHSGKLKGLSGYLQNHHDMMVGDKTQQSLGLALLLRHLIFVHMKAEDHMVCGLFIHMKVEAHCGASLLGFASNHRVVMNLQVPHMSYF